MSTIIKKSNHPVEVKKINLRIWTLRDELEAAIQKRIIENNNSTDNLDIEDIKAFYSGLRPKNGPVDDLDDDEDHSDENLDASGNPMDDDAAAMMAAMGGDESSDDEQEQESEDEQENEDSTDEDTGESDEGEEEEEDDDEAAAMAAAMLEGQGADSPSEESKSSKDTDGSKPKFQRVFPKFKDEDRGYAFLSELYMDRFFIFSKRPFTYGQNIIIEILIPQKFSVSAEVKSIAHIRRTSKLISQNMPNYRVECELTFMFEGDRANLRNFLQSVELELPPEPKKIKKAEASEDDDFDDLGF